MLKKEVTDIENMIDKQKTTLLKNKSDKVEDEAILDYSNINNENIIEQDKKLYLEVIQHIIKFIEKENDYRWIYKDKNLNKNLLLAVYHCNCCIDRAKRQAKHPNSESQRDTSTN
ncbi:8360_t:CDS:2 [Gigaspora margarita]|uniref:8360_t:CDS:1 n=1 Tax=Gigaspora margarita TaxID=4874 RepID=A0ABN7W301_GIGMA|nr:8360_t:CDS:2 [Gigaspora margarita]